MILVYRYRVKSLSGLLNRQARSVNFVWNFCNETQKHALKWNKRWPSGIDLNYLTIGSSKELGIHSGTVNAVCEQYAKSRAQHKRPYLRWRGSKSLGWVPLKGRDMREHRDGFLFHGKLFRVFKSRDLPKDAKIKDGTNFSRDASGNWYLNVAVEISEAEQKTGVAVGIDLGLETFAALSDGSLIEHGREYRKLEPELAKAQRANKKQKARSIQAKVAAKRKDFLHKLSTKLCQSYASIAVGNVNAGGLAKTILAKSVLDASWSSFRRMLAYKAIRHGARYAEVNEAFTSQTCSCCGARPRTGPKGVAGLAIRRFECSECGGSLNRDVNSARNILAISGFGREAPVVGIPAI